MLSKIGYRFDPNEMTSFDVEVYGTIAARLAELEKKDMEKANKKSSPRRK